MEDFDQYMNEYLVKWRLNHFQNQEEGTQNGKTRPWILPGNLWAGGLWHGIRTADNSFCEYLYENKIRKNDGAHNLKSSWVLSANLYFAFRNDPSLVAGFFKEHVSQSIEEVEKIELEYVDPDESLKPTPLLGEPPGQIGRNQTSPDIAFAVKLTNGKKGLILTDIKFTEHSFSSCSGRKPKYGNPDPRRCRNFKQVYADIENQCYLRQWQNKQRTNRKYWEHLRFAPEAVNTLIRCPAATAGYQLFRQQALAEALASKGPYDLVVSSVAYDARNQTLIDCLYSTGIDDFTTGWGPLFNGKAKFATFTHQDWVKWVRDNDTEGKWNHWFQYVKYRYCI